MTITLCVDCDNVAEHTRKLQQYQWLCVKFPRVEGGSFIDPTWKNDPPYNYCHRINLGHCPLYQPRPEQKGSDNG